MKWHYVEDETPPYNQPVFLHIILPHDFTMHVYGWYNEKGWFTLSNIPEFRVEKWSYFCNHEKK